MATHERPSSISTSKEPLAGGVNPFCTFFSGTWREGGGEATSQPPGGRWGARPSLPSDLPHAAEGSRGSQPHPPTHQHVYALHGGGVHPPGFKRPVCPKMALQSRLLGGKTRAEGLQQLFCAVLCLSQPIWWAPSLTLFLPSVPELHSSQIGDQNPIL